MSELTDDAHEEWLRTANLTGYPGVTQLRMYVYMLIREVERLQRENGELATGNLYAQHRAAIANQKLKEELSVARAEAARLQAIVDQPQSVRFRFIGEEKPRIVTPDEEDESCG